MTFKFNRHQTAWNYGVAIVFVLVALLLMLALDPLLQLQQTTFLLFFGALTLSAWYGGRGAGILATLLSAVCASFFLIPRISSTPGLDWIVKMLLFMLQGCLISLLIGSLRMTQLRLKRLLYERDQAEAALQHLTTAESEERLRLAIENAGMATWDVNLQTGSVNWSENHFTLLGYPPGLSHEGTDELWRSRVYADDWDMVQQSIEQAKQNRSLCSIEYRIARADTGEIRWLSAYARFLYSPSGQPVRFVGVFFDVTERKQVEASLREGQERLALAMDAGGMAAWELNPLNSAVITSSNAAEIYGLSQIQTTEQGFSLVHPDDLARHRAIVDQAVAQKSSYHSEFRIIRPDTGAIVWLEERGKVLLNEDGTLQKMIGVAIDITKRKQIEAELQRSNDRFYAAMRAVEGIVFEWNLDTQTVYRSEGLLELVGVRSEDAPPTRQWWIERIHPEDLGRIETETPAFFAGSDRYEGEYRVRHEAGHWVHVWERGCLKRNAQGEVISIVGFTTDITERKQAEAALRQSEARLQVVAANLPQGALFIVDHELRYRLAEGKALHDVGLTSNYFVGKTLWEALNADLAEFYAPYYRRVLSGETFSLEHFSHDRHYSSHGIPLYNSQGEVEAALAVSYDITERKRIEDEREQAAIELRQKNAILDAINKSAPTPIFVKDREGRIIYANPATLTVFGKSAEEVIGLRDCDIATPLEDALKVMENDRRIMESGQMEVVEESPDGIRTFLGMKMPYLNEAGEVIGLIGISNDITERVQLERERLRVADERERILQQEQAAREAAEQANRMKDEFLAVLSHELRSPLNPILGWAKLLQQGNLDANRQRDALATIERNAKLQAQLVEDLLDISRIMRGKLTLNTAPVSLTFVIPAAIETVRLAAEAKQIAIDLNLPSIFLPVWGDAARLQQVVWNLLTNAVKFTPNGGSVEVRLREVGAGERGSNEVGELGNTQSHEASNHPSPPYPLTARLNGLHILLVDDDDDTREFQAFVLRQNGALVTAVSSGSAALQVLEQCKPDVMVSDIGMAEMNGYTLIRQIRDWEASQRFCSSCDRLPAIAVSAYAADTDQRQSIAAGFQRHLSKPIHPEMLVKTIVDVVKQGTDA
ncbi:PAS domain S-box protein [Leptolyngbya ohadii]|uniref:PAS domain S-box protein n=1 Tax=Leptolyngbya ohadii TaxID=1962290 RepID=UPI000B5A125B|nr:PAS domain S-box protein [Leptolyngbya ohadii]